MLNYNIYVWGITGTKNYNLIEVNIKFNELPQLIIYQNKFYKLVNERDYNLFYEESPIFNLSTLDWQTNFPTRDFNY